MIILIRMLIIIVERTHESEEKRDEKKLIRFLATEC